jgi:hypothetical protein
MAAVLADAGSVCEWACLTRIRLAARRRVLSAFAIERSHIDDWVSTLLERGEVIARRRDTAMTCCTPGVDPEQVRWEFENSLHPPKEVLLPQTDPLFDIRGDRAGWQFAALPPAGPRILLNARSCDVSGLQFLRRVHASDLEDPAFLRRDAGLTVISLSCPTPCPQGFCVCCDAGPFLDSGFDIQLTDLGEVMLAETSSAKGEELVRTTDGLFRPATGEELSRRCLLEALASVQLRRARVTRVGDAPDLNRAGGGRPVEHHVRLVLRVQRLHAGVPDLLLLLDQGSAGGVSGRCRLGLLPVCCVHARGVGSGPSPTARTG